MAKGGSKAKGKKSQCCAIGEKDCIYKGGPVTWVYCEITDAWFHCPCVKVDPKKANDEDFIFISPFIRPQKEKEFNAIKNDLKKQIGQIMDRHPVFSAALIARKCFATKSASNEYHFGRPGIPVTLRELEEKMSRDVTSVYQFKHMAKVMSERMVASVKGEFATEAKTIKTEIEKLLKGLESNTSAPPPPPVNNSSTTTKKGRGGNRGNNKENDNTTEKPAASKPEPPVKSRETKRKAAASTAAAEKVEQKAETKPPAATSAKGRRGAPAKKAKKEDTKEDSENVVVAPAEKPAPPMRGRRGAKKAESNATQKKTQNENVPNDTSKTTEVTAPNAAPTVASTKKQKEDATNKSETTPAAAATSTTATAGTGRGRKRKNALTPVNSNRGTKVPKTVTTVAAKIISSPGSPAKVAIAGSNLVNLSALSQPLPPQVVLPTTPLAAPQVQSLKSTAPPPQLIQLRPTGPGGVGQTMQIRPVRATGPSAAGGPRPQFFKIVGGKPVQISAANLHRLPASAITSIQPQAGRVMYMRAPGPASTSAVTSATSSALATSAAGVTTLTSSGVAAASSGNKIILLSNKGQAIPVSKAGGAPPSIVRVVSPNSVTSGIGGKITLSPGSPTKLAALRPAGSSVPILLRTVAPRPAGGSPPIQLPMAPLPKSALNNAGDKKSDASAKAIQVLLPKSPLPPQSAQSPNNAATSKISKNPGSTTTTTTTASGAFVWTNSTRANFKLSSRINFSSLDKFKNVVNKDVHFILANIVTEDKSNEFSFRLHLKREPVKSVTSNADKKDATAAAATESYLELEAKAKVPTAQEWSLKVKTEPPVFLVSGGNFLSDFPATRIPKDIADKPFVDYELHIDKCSPTQVATGKGSVAKMAAAAAAAAAAGGQPAAKRGRKVAAK